MRTASSCSRAIRMPFGVGKATRPARSPPPADVLDLRVLLEAPAPALAADAARLEAAEGRIEQVEPVVDPDGAGADAAREGDGTRRVARIDRAAEAVGRIVRDA